MSSAPPYICRRCIAALPRRTRPGRIRPEPRSCLRLYSDGSNSKDKQDVAPATGSSNPKDGPTTSDPPPEKGAMSRRLEEATEEALFTGGRAGRRAVEDAGFSDELKERLLDKIANAKFRDEHSTAFTSAGLNSSTMNPRSGSSAAGLSQPWTGEESQSDAVLRMINDSHRPLAPGLRGKPKIQDIAPVDMRLRPTPNLSPGEKAANARERAAAYTGMGLGGKTSDNKAQSDKERAAIRDDFRDRFASASRKMPATLSGLAALANERIEDAISRGQFKNIPRGKGIERDARADNPFIDTTEYIMNKMIKRQEIVPPWIEKQQEVVRAADVFRTRLRTDWRRHAAREISRTSGGVEAAIRRAREYARAEEVVNPRRRRADQTTIPTTTTDDPVMRKMRESAGDDVGSAEANIAAAAGAATGARPESETTTATDDPDPGITLSQPFRDPQWEATERAYMELSVKNLNTMTRSYNLMAPELAKKPYFSLERELRSCFADIAPQLANTIKERAGRPAAKVGAEGQSTSVLDRFGRASAKNVKVYDSKSPHYGVKEMWRDFWARRS